MRAKPKKSADQQPRDENQVSEKDVDAVAGSGLRREEKPDPNKQVAFTTRMSEPMVRALDEAVEAHRFIDSRNAYLRFLVEEHVMKG